ncbi:MAG: hypothetical protein JXD22_13370 [Sedimentisphaerales bacterium]|nr:hypothetical protein [Sedimentisphaerales bacterium]
MSAKEYSKHQQKVIKRYYDNLDSIKLQKLQELVTDLYLAKDTPKEEKLWDRAEKAMLQLKIKPKIIEHIMVKRSVEVLAENLKDWMRS